VLGVVARRASPQLLSHSRLAEGFAGQRPVRPLAPWLTQVRNACVDRPHPKTRNQPSGDLEQVCRLQPPEKLVPAVSGGSRPRQIPENPQVRNPGKKFPKQAGGF